MQYYRNHMKRVLAALLDAPPMNMGHDILDRDSPLWWLLSCMQEMTSDGPPIPMNRKPRLTMTRLLAETALQLCRRMIQRVCAASKWDS